MAWQILPGLFELGNGRTRVAEADQRHTENEPGLGVIGHQVDGLLGGLGRGLEASGSQQTVTAKHQVVGQEESGGCIFGVLLGDQPEAIFGRVGGTGDIGSEGTFDLDGGPLQILELLEGALPRLIARHGACRGTDSIDLAQDVFRVGVLADGEWT